jgi:ADP-ribosylglycohydrolase
MKVFRPTGLDAYLKAPTIITHTDPKAYWGALAVALAAHQNFSSCLSVDAKNYYNRLEQVLDPEMADDFLDLIKQVVESVAKGNPTREFVESQKLQKGITGYTYHSIPAVIHAWLLNPRDFKNAILEIIGCGGDSDTTAATLGGIVGAAVGSAGIPNIWMNNLWEWPRTIRWMRQLGQQLDMVLISTRPETPLRLPLIGILLRNLLFTSIILFHAIRRLLPPY